MATKFANDSINKYHQAASDDLYDFLRPKSYIESYRNMAYKDPWFALGEFLGREYIGNYNRRGNEKATTAAQELVDAELNNIANPQQQSPQPSVQVGTSPASLTTNGAPVGASGIPDVSSYVGTAPSVSIGAPTNQQQPQFQTDVNSYIGQAPALGLQQVQQQPYVPKSPDQMKAQYWSQQKQAGRPEWQIRQGWDNVKDSLASYTQKYNNNRVDDIISRDKDTIFSDDDVAASNVIGNIAKYDPTKAQMLWEARNNRIKMAHENELYSMRHAGGSGGSSTKGTTAGMFNYHDVATLNTMADSAAKEAESYSRQLTDIEKAMETPEIMADKVRLDRLKQQKAQYQAAYERATQNAQLYRSQAQAMANYVYPFSNNNNNSTPQQSAVDAKQAQQEKVNAFMENKWAEMKNKILADHGLYGAWDDSKLEAAAKDFRKIASNTKEYPTSIRQWAKENADYYDNERKANIAKLNNKAMTGDGRSVQQKHLDWHNNKMKESQQGRTA